MKKSTIFMMFAAAASLASCTAQGPKANIKSDVDSLSYMIGMTNTQGLKDYVISRMGVDTAYMADFIRGIEQGTKETDAKQKAYMAGMQIGQQISGDMFDAINDRIFNGDSTQNLSKENFLAGFVSCANDVPHASTKHIPKITIFLVVFISFLLEIIFSFYLILFSACKITKKN